MTTLDERRCIYPECVATWRHWHGGFPGGYDNPADPEGPPIPFEDDNPEPDAVRDYNGAVLPVTSLDDLEWSEPTTPATPTGAGPRRHRHVWGIFVNRGLEMRCKLCDAIRDEAAARRGRSARRLGHDGERRSRDRYGFTKVGQYGGITDLRGKAHKVQQKTSRRPAPPRWQAIFRALDTVADGRTPAILLSFVKVGTPTQDYFVIRGSDWLDLFGRDSEAEG